MGKLDNQNRLQIPHEILEIAPLSFEKEVRIYLKDNSFFIDNPAPSYKSLACLGIIRIDKKNRFFLSKAIRTRLCIRAGDTVLCYLQNDTIVFEKISDYT